jgi:hypothetical protein
MGANFIVVGVTARAVRLVLAKRPSCVLRIGLMAIETINTGSMIAGIRCRRVIELYLQPIVGVVTLVTLHSCDEMLAGLTCGGCSVMTT